MEVSEIERRLREGPSLKKIKLVEDILTKLRGENEANARTLLNDAFSRGLIELTPAGEWEYRRQFPDFDTIELPEIQRRLGGASFRGIKMAEDILGETNETNVGKFLEEVFSRKLIRLTSTGEWEYLPPDHLTMEAREIERRLKEGPSFHRIGTIENILIELKVRKNEMGAREILNEMFSQGLIELTPEGKWQYRPPPPPEIEPINTILPPDLKTIVLPEIRRRLEGANFHGIKMAEDILGETNEVDARALLGEAFS